MGNRLLGHRNNADRFEISCLCRITTGIFPIPGSSESYERYIQSIDDRHAALRIVLESIDVHSVSKVQYSTQTSRVSRHRMESRETEF